MNGLTFGDVVAAGRRGYGQARQLLGMDPLVFLLMAPSVLGIARLLINSPLGLPLLVVALVTLTRLTRQEAVAAPPIVERLLALPVPEVQQLPALPAVQQERLRGGWSWLRGALEKRVSRLLAPGHAVD